MSHPLDQLQLIESSSSLFYRPPFAKRGDGLVRSTQQGRTSEGVRNMTFDVVLCIMGWPTTMLCTPVPIVLIELAVDEIVSRVIWRTSGGVRQYATRTRFPFDGLRCDGPLEIQRFRTPILVSCFDWIGEFGRGVLNKGISKRCFIVRHSCPNNRKDTHSR